MQTLSGEVFRIAKSFKFSASHQQLGLDPTHPCARLHGHNYELIIYLESETYDKTTGFVFDVYALKPIKDYIDSTLDHRHLNEVLSFPPSCELLAKHFFWLAHALTPLVAKVRLYETETIFAEYELRKTVTEQIVEDVRRALDDASHKSS